VSICTPPSAHSEGVLQALDAGARRVICEKPCTESLDEIEDLVTRVGERGGAVGINSSRRFDPLHRRVLSMAAAQRIRGVIGHYTAGILNTGSHWLADLISLGRPIERVRALPLDDGDDPTPCLLLFLGGGAVAYLEGHFVSDYLIYEMDVFTDEARVSLLDSGTGARILSRGESPRFSGYAELAPDGETLPQGLIDPLLAVVDDAVVSVKEDRPMLCPLADGVAVHKVIAAAHESLRTGADVPIEATR
jgi:predicted dehydrogenase